MGMESFDVNGVKRQGYLALPASGKGPGVLVLHAWWGLNEVFRGVCDKLAKEGFVAFAPDVHHGVVTSDKAEALNIVQTRDFAAAMATTQAGLGYLQKHPAVTSKQLGALGFSMGGSFATELDKANPDALKAIVTFYDDWAAQNYKTSKARFLFHFAENDPEVADEIAKAVKGENATVYFYPGTHHWFFEENRPEDYVPEAARLAWERTVAFFKIQRS